MPKSTLRYEFSHPDLPLVVFSQFDVNRYSSKWNTTRVPAEFGTADFNEAVGDMLFDKVTPEQSDWIERNLDLKTVGRYTHRL